QNFLGQVAQTGVPKFPYVGLSGYPTSILTGNYIGAGNPSNRTYRSWNVNGSFSKFVGTHTFKMGADYRKIGVHLLTRARASGCFNLGKEFPSATGLNNSSTTDGNAMASFLLGYPSGDAGNLSTMTLTTPLDIYTNYYGGYLQDDWRLSSKFT